MKQKLNKGLERDSRMLKSVSRLLKNYKIDEFKFKVSINKNKYLKMLKNRYISCLISLNNMDIKRGIKEINNIYPDKILFDDTLTCIMYKL